MHRRLPRSRKQNTRGPSIAVAEDSKLRWSNINSACHLTRYDRCQQPRRPKLSKLIHLLLFSFYDSRTNKLLPQHFKNVKLGRQMQLYKVSRTLHAVEVLSILSYSLKPRSVRTAEPSKYPHKPRYAGVRRMHAACVTCNGCSPLPGGRVARYPNPNLPVSAIYCSHQASQVSHIIEPPTPHTWRGRTREVAQPSSCVLAHGAHERQALARALVLSELLRRGNTTIGAH